MLSLVENKESYEFSCQRFTVHELKQHKMFGLLCLYTGLGTKWLPPALPPWNLKHFTCSNFVIFFLHLSANNYTILILNLKSPLFPFVDKKLISEKNMQFYSMA